MSGQIRMQPRWHIYLKKGNKSATETSRDLPSSFTLKRGGRKKKQLRASEISRQDVALNSSHDHIISFMKYNPRISQIVTYVGAISFFIIPPRFHTIRITPKKKLRRNFTPPRFFHSDPPERKKNIR